MFIYYLFILHYDLTGCMICFIILRNDFPLPSCPVITY